jgi:hypothetical protein
MGSISIFGKEYCELSYQSPNDISKINNADQISLNVNVINNHLERVLCRKRSGIGLKGGDMILKNDITEVMSHAFKSELMNRGFNISTNGITVELIIEKIGMNFKSGKWGIPAHSEMAAIFNLLKMDGSIFYSERIISKAKSNDTITNYNKHAELALKENLTVLFSELFNNRGFINQIFESSKNIIKKESFDEKEFERGILLGEILPSKIEKRIDEKGEYYLNFKFPKYSCQIHVHFSDDILEIISYAHIKLKGKGNRKILIGNQIIAMLRHYTKEIQIYDKIK